MMRPNQAINLLFFFNLF